MGDSSIMRRHGLPQKERTVLGTCFALYLFSTVFDFLAIVPGVSLARLTGVVLVAIALGNARHMILPKSSGVAFLFGLLFFALVVFLLMDHPEAGLNQFFSVALNALIALIASLFLITEKDYRLCGLSLCVAGALMCVLLFLSPGAVGTEWVSDRVVVNIAGSQQDPNELCGYFLFVVSALTYCAITKSRWWYLVFVAVFLYSILLTGSRGGLIANIAAVLVAFAFGFRATNRKMRWVVLLAIVSLVLVASFDSILASLPPSIASRFLEASFSGGTASFRTQAWGDVLGSFFDSSLLNQFFGHGYGSTTEVTFNGLVAHNSYIEVLYTLGLAGLVCYVGVIALAVKRAFLLKRPVVLICIVGFLALLMTLSAYSFKPFWAVLTLGFMRIGDASSRESRERR